MNDLQIFTYQGNDLRTVEKDGEIWWVLKDVCNTLSISDHRSAGRRLDDDEKGVGQIPSPGGVQDMTIINEPGLYNVILRSDKPEAKDFKRWVTHDVLPSIRKTGAYVSTSPMTTNQLILETTRALAQTAEMVVSLDQRVTALTDKAESLTEQTNALTARMDGVARAFYRSDTVGEWKVNTELAIRAMSKSIGFRGRLYQELETRAGCNLNIRLTRARNRLRKNGMTTAQANKVNKLDIICMDKNLRSIFDAIIREHQAVYAGIAEQQVIDAEFEEVV